MDKKPQPDFSIEQLLKEIGSPITAGGGLTSEEICQRKGWAKSTVRGKLKKLFREGKLVCNRKQVSRIDGVMVSVPTYQLKTDKTVTM